MDIDVNGGRMVPLSGRALRTTPKGDTNMIPIKLLAAAAALLLALPAAAQTTLPAEKRAQPAAQSGQLNQKERKKLAKPCSSKNGKSAAAK